LTTHTTDPSAKMRATKWRRPNRDILSSFVQCPSAPPLGRRVLRRDVICVRRVVALTRACRPLRCHRTAIGTGRRMLLARSWSDGLSRSRRVGLSFGCCRVHQGVERLRKADVSVLGGCRVQKRKGPEIRWCCSWACSRNITVRGRDEAGVAKHVDARNFSYETRGIVGIEDERCVLAT
jgi:hypothetical protein